MNALQKFRHKRSHDPRPSGFCEISKGLDRQPICRGCKNVETLLEVHREQQRRGEYPPQAMSQRFHLNYKELNSCAKVCVTCRVFRQALLLKQVTHKESPTSMDQTSPLPIIASISPTTTWGNPRFGAEVSISVSIGKAESYSSSAVVSCLDSNNLGSLTLPKEPKDPRIFEQVEKWLKNCTRSHPGCNNLHWSSKNPKRLCRILSDSQLQLIHSPQKGERLGYTALSYCWGDKTLMSESEKDKIVEGMTTTHNLQLRSKFFDLTDLPETVQDAVILTRRLKIEYIWVDTICIVQDDLKDWEREAPTMHEVYGNARFTICASSSEKATDRLLQERECWSYATEPCRLSNKWIGSNDMSLNEMRARSPLSKRAWTLQEEYLSIRLLYWSSQRMFWSCAGGQDTESELAQRATARPSARRSARSPYEWNLKPSQRFLISCRNGESSHLHEDWLDVVESYTQRHLSKEGDRFTAVSGLASRYQLAQQGDEYLAGLWRRTFAEDLAWSVTRAVNREDRKDLQDLIPTWSWASLP